MLGGKVAGVVLPAVPDNKQPGAGRDSGAQRTPGPLRQSWRRLPLAPDPACRLPDPLHPPRSSSLSSRSVARAPPGRPRSRPLATWQRRTRGLAKGGQDCQQRAMACHERATTSGTKGGLAVTGGRCHTPPTCANTNSGGQRPPLKGSSKLMDAGSTTRRVAAGRPSLNRTRTTSQQSDQAGAAARRHQARPTRRNGSPAGVRDRPALWRARSAS